MSDDEWFRWMFWIGVGAAVFLAVAPGLIVLLVVA